MVLKNKRITYFEAFYRINILFLCLIILAGCSVLKTFKDPLIDGVYIARSFSQFGLSYEVYQFLPDNKVYFSKRKFLNNEDINKWAHDDTRKISNYLKNNGKIHIYSNVKGYGSSYFEEEMSELGGIINSRFYSFTESGLNFEFKTEIRKTNNIISIYNKQGEFLFSERFKRVKEITNDALLFESSSEYLLYNPTQKSEILRAPYIKAFTDNNNFIMAFINSNFGVIDVSGNVVLPFVYDDMMYLGNNIFGVLSDGKWEIRDISGNVYIKLGIGEYPNAKLLPGHIVPIKTGKKVKFYSLKIGKYLNIESYDFSSVISSDKFFKIKGKDGWLLMDGEKLVLPFYLSSVTHHIYNYIVATDTQGTTAVFTEDGELYSNTSKGSLSPIYNLNGSYINNTVPLLKYTKNHRSGIVNMKGDIIVEPIYRDVKFLGKNYFGLIQGDDLPVKIYAEGKGILPISFEKTRYFDGKVIIVKDQSSKYGLWNLDESNFLIQGLDYISAGFSSDYIVSEVSKGKEDRYSVIKGDGTIIYPNEFTERFRIYKNYFSNVEGVYELPSMKRIMDQPKGQLSVTNNYLVFTYISIPLQ